MIKWAIIGGSLLITVIALVLLKQILGLVMLIIGIALGIYIRGLIKGRE